MGIRLPGRDRFRLLVRQRSAATRRLRLVRRQLRQEDASRRPEEAQSVGPLRHARQRGRVVPGCLRPELLQDQPREEPARTGRAATNTSSAAARGNRPPTPCGRPTGSARTPASPTPAWPAMPLASAACARRRPRRMQDKARRLGFSLHPFRGNHALPHLGLLRLLPDRLPGLPARSPKQPVDEHLVDDRLVHVLRLVESLVPPAALRHLGDRLPHGPLDGAEPADAHVLARDQPGQQFRVPRLLQILRLPHREPERVPRAPRSRRAAARPESRIPTPCSRSWAFRRTTSSPR